MQYFNPYAAAGLFRQYNMMQEPWHVGIHMRVLSERYSLNTNMTGFRWLWKFLCVLVLWKEIASALKGLNLMYCNNNNSSSNNNNNNNKRK